MPLHFVKFKELDSKFLKLSQTIRIRKLFSYHILVNLICLISSQLSDWISLFDISETSIHTYGLGIVCEFEAIFSIWIVCNILKYVCWFDHFGLKILLLHKFESDNMILKSFW